MRKIAIEKTLTDVRDILESNNYKVDILDDNIRNSSTTLDQYDAIVVTGAESNVMGFQNAETVTQIINAKGKTAEEVYSEISDRVR